jgi:hypothetical protein
MEQTLLDETLHAQMADVGARPWLHWRGRGGGARIKLWWEEARDKP